jgi:Ca-activated chloride channel family protein
MSQLLALAAQYARVPSNIATEFYASVTITPPAVSAAARPALAIGVALDVSGSMAGPKLDSAKESLLKLVDHLAVGDTLAIVAFGSGVEVVLPAVKMDATGKSSARAKIARIHINGSTNLSGGLFKAIDLLHEADVAPSTMKRALLFTDGQANMGMQGKELLAAAEKYAKAQGVGIATFGYGADHDSDLLSALAQGGGFHYISSADAILGAFGAELGGLIATYGQNVELTVEAAKDVEIVEVLNELKTKRNEDGDVTVTCDDLLAEQPYVVVVKMKALPTTQAEGADRPLFTTRLAYTHLGQVKRVEEWDKLGIVAGTLEASKSATKVLEHVAYQKAVGVQTKAMSFANAGDLVGARGVLNDFIGFAHSIGTEDAMELGLMANALINEAFSDNVTYATSGKHTSNSLKSSLGKRRGFSEVGVAASLGVKYGSSSETVTRASFKGTGQTPKKTP